MHLEHHSSCGSHNEGGGSSTGLVWSSSTSESSRGSWGSRGNGGWCDNCGGDNNWCNWCSDSWCGDGSSFWWWVNWHNGGGNCWARGNKCLSSDDGGDLSDGCDYWASRQSNDWLIDGDWAVGSPRSRSADNILAHIAVLGVVAVWVKGAASVCWSTRVIRSKSSRDESWDNGK